MAPLGSIALTSGEARGPRASPRMLQIPRRRCSGRESPTRVERLKASFAGTRLAGSFLEIFPGGPCLADPVTFPAWEGPSLSLSLSRPPTRYDLRERKSERASALGRLAVLWAQPLALMPKRSGVPRGANAFTQALPSSRSAGSPLPPPAFQSGSEEEIPFG